MSSHESTGLTRREALAVAGAGIIASQGKLVSAEPLKVNRPVCVFAKPLQHLSFDELGKRLKAIGAKGIEATLRPGGQIEPQDFGRRLPELCEALAKHEQRVVIATCNINQVTSESLQQLEAFKANGIQFLRTNYYRFDLKKPLLPQIDVFAKKAIELAETCADLGVCALYQNHAGDKYLGAALWDVLGILKEVNPKGMKLAFDVRHASLELTQSWPSALRAVESYVGALFVKDFKWQDGKVQNVPLGDGGTSAVLMRALKRPAIAEQDILPVSLHVEYFDHKAPGLQEQRWQAVENDMQVLRQTLSKV